MNEGLPEKCKECPRKPICLPYDYYSRPHALTAHLLECMLIASPALVVVLVIVAVIGFDLTTILPLLTMVMILVAGFLGGYGHPEDIECGHYQQNLPEITGRNYIDKKKD